MRQRLVPVYRQLLLTYTIRYFRANNLVNNPSCKQLRDDDGALGTRAAHFAKSNLTNIERDERAQVPELRCPLIQYQWLLIFRMHCRACRGRNGEILAGDMIFGDIRAIPSTGRVYVSGVQPYFPTTLLQYDMACKCVDSSGLSSCLSNMGEGLEVSS